MRKPFALLPALALAASLLAQAPASKSTEAPKFAPHPAGEFVIHMPDGTDKLLTSYKGKLVVLAFMYTTCPHCQHLAGVLAKIQTDYAAKGVQVVGATFDQNAKRDVANFNKVFGVNFPCGYSTEAPVLQFMHSPPGYFIPMLSFIDRTGTIRNQILPKGDGGPAEQFLAEDKVEGNIRKEIDKYLKASAAPKAAPKP
jgi:thiol-disulfide isomerase/thioredoxin